MKNRPASQSEPLTVAALGKVIGVIALAASALALAKNYKAIKRLVELHRM